MADTVGGAQHVYIANVLLILCLLVDKPNKFGGTASYAYGLICIYHQNCKGTWPFIIVVVVKLGG